MIKKLTLSRFGKFSDRVFELAPVTVFYGENEAGKTTVFDALFDALCKPNGANSFGKLLKARYGTERAAAIEPANLGGSVAPEDFMGIFAVRSGEIDLDLPENSAWMNRIRSRLFSDGIDPQILIDALSGEINTRGNSRYAKARKVLDERIAGLEGRLGEAEEKRRQCIGAERNVASLEGAHERAHAERQELKSRTDEMKELAHQQELIQELKNVRTVAALLTELGTARTELSRLEAFATDRSAELDALERRVAAANLAWEKAEALLVRARTDETELSRIRATAEREAAEAARAGDLATTVKLGLPGREALIRRRMVTVWKVPLLVAAAGALAAGIAVLMLAPGPLSYAGLAVGAGLAAFLAIRARSQREEEDRSAFDAFLARLREQWLDRTGTPWGTTSGITRGPAAEAASPNFPGAAPGAVSYERIVIELEHAITFADEKRRAAQAAAETAAKKDTEAAGLEADAAGGREALDTARRALADRLATLGVPSRDDYIAQVQKRRGIAASAAGLEARAREAAAVLGLGTGPGFETELGAACARRVGQLEGEIREKELPQPEFRALQNRLAQGLKRLEELERLEKESYGDYKGTLAEARAAFRGLPELVSRLEGELAAARRERAELDIDLEASQQARDIFAQIGEDSEAMFEELSSRIGSTYADIVRLGGSVRFDSFRTGEAVARDAEGNERTGEQLSRGTRDAFYLAARLSLAEKAGDIPIVLDEPFLALDAGRIDNVFGVLARFRKGTGRQLILLTKEEAVRAAALRAFPDARLHTLTRSPGTGESVRA